MSRVIFLFFILFVLTLKSYSQQSKVAAWFFLSHTQKLTKKFNFLADVQVRSDDKIIHTETLLLRGAINYNFSDKYSAALGYAYKADWMENDEHENRIYEQSLFKSEIGKIDLTVRARLEQRFINETDKADFSQRARIFFSAQIPIVANKDFSRGLYSTIQNEYFANVQNKEKVNNSFFDQNRTFVSIGYRWSKKIDTEAGYMYWYQQEMDKTTAANVFQLMITTQL